MSEVQYIKFDNPEIEYLCKKDKRLAKTIHMVGEYSYKPYEDEYAFLVEQIISQMLGIKVSAKIIERLRFECNGSICPETIQSLDKAIMRNTGMSAMKVTYIKNLTDCVINKELSFADFQYMSDKEVIRQLTMIKGIGQWTAKMYLIFVLDRKDVLPYEDMAFLQAYGWLYNTKDYKKENVVQKCKKWKPYSSIAARFLYKALDSGLTKSPFCL